MSAHTIDDLLPILKQKFSRLSESANLDAQVLMAHVIHRPRAWVLAHPDYALSAQELKSLEGTISEMEHGIPLPYVIGFWEFYGRKFLLTPDVLIPRPETELLVEKASQWLSARQSGMKQKDLLAADIGCGSGCIAISLLADHSNLHVIATDISFPALKVTSRNASMHSVEARIHPVQCDLLPPIAVKFDLICANLPYIPTQTLTQLSVYQKEPTLALDGGMDGLDLIDRLIAESPSCLAPTGSMFLEIETSQGPRVMALARSTFPHAAIELFQDLGGHDRLICIQQGT